MKQVHHIINQLENGEKTKRAFFAENEDFCQGKEYCMQRRVKLIDLVLNQHYSVVRASRKLELKPYTARSIVNKYRRDGVIFDYQARKFINPDVITLQNQELSENEVKKE